MSTKITKNSATKTTTKSMTKTTTKSTGKKSSDEPQSKAVVTTFKPAKTAKVVKSIKAAEPVVVVKALRAPKTAQPTEAVVASKAAQSTKVAQPAQGSAKAVSPVAQPTISNDPIRIFQIHYLPEQRAQLDPAFIPINNAQDKNPLLEYNVFRKLFKNEVTQGAQLWGAVSWKFQQRTGLSGQDLRQLINANPGYDLYYCNPEPEVESLYHNLWLHGETAHPNFLILVKEFFEVAGWPLSHLTRLEPSRNFSVANYFVGTPKFWNSYFLFIEQALNAAEQKLSPTAKAMLVSSAADWRGLHAQASYLPFIIERALTVFLDTPAGQQLRTFKYALPARVAKENVHQKLLREMKDTAIANRSNWLAACWVNYRNLYLVQTQDKPWVRQFLRSITPTNFTFPTSAPTNATEHAVKTIAVQSNVVVASEATPSKRLPKPKSPAPKAEEIVETDKKVLIKPKAVSKPVSVAQTVVDTTPAPKVKAARTRGR